MTLKVYILGSGNAAAKHRAAFAELPELWEVIDNWERADAVSICTPNHLHFEQAGKVIHYGKQAIVEKPLCGSLAQCDQLTTIQQIDRRICPIFQYRFAPSAFTNSRRRFSWRRDADYFNGWRGQWETALGGVLTSHVIHVLDRIAFFAAPSVVEAHTVAYRHGLEEIAVVHAAEKTYRFSISQMYRYGEKHLGNSHAGYVIQFRLIHEALTTGGPLPVTLTEARQSLELLTACYQSAFIGEPVTLPIAPDDPWYQGWTQHFARRQQQFPASQKISLSPDRPIVRPSSAAHLSRPDPPARPAR